MLEEQRARREDFWKLAVIQFFHDALSTLFTSQPILDFFSFSFKQTPQTTILPRPTTGTVATNHETCSVHDPRLPRFFCRSSRVVQEQSRSVHLVA